MHRRDARSRGATTSVRNIAWCILLALVLAFGAGAQHRAVAFAQTPGVDGAQPVVTDPTPQPAATTDQQASPDESQPADSSGQTTSGQPQPAGPGASSTAGSSDQQTSMDGSQPSTTDGQTPAGSTQPGGSGASPSAGSGDQQASPDQSQSSSTGEQTSSGASSAGPSSTDVPVCIPAGPAVACVDISAPSAPAAGAPPAAAPGASVLNCPFNGTGAFTCVTTGGGSPAKVANCAVDSTASSLVCATSTQGSPTLTPLACRANGGAISQVLATSSSANSPSILSVLGSSGSAQSAAANLQGFGSAAGGFICTVYKEGQVFGKLNCLTTVAGSLACGIVTTQGPAGSFTCEGVLVCTAQVAGIGTIQLNCLVSTGLTCTVMPTAGPVAPGAAPQPPPPSPAWLYCSLPGGGSGWVQRPTSAGSPSC